MEWIVSLIISHIVIILYNLARDMLIQVSHGVSGLFLLQPPMVVNTGTTHFKDTWGKISALTNQVIN